MVAKIVSDTQLQGQKEDPSFCLIRRGYTNLKKRPSEARLSRVEIMLSFTITYIRKIKEDIIMNKKEMKILSDLKLKKIPSQPKGKINNGAQLLNLRLIILIVNLKKKKIKCNYLLF